MPNRAAAFRLATAALTLLALGACVPRATAPAPAPAAAFSPPATPPAPATAPPPPSDWQTGPLGSGDWSYQVAAGVPIARFGPFAIRCTRGQVVQISLMGPQGAAIVIRTSFGERRLPGSPDHFQSFTALPASDPLLDQMAFSRGRFLVTSEAGPSLVVPAWPEIGRVIEECRGQ